MEDLWDFRKKIRVDHIDTSAKITQLLTSRELAYQGDALVSFLKAASWIHAINRLKCPSHATMPVTKTYSLSITHQKVSAADVTNAISRMLTGEKLLKIGLGENSKNKE